MRLPGWWPETGHLHTPRERALFWTCWLLWRIASARALVIVFLILATVALALRPTLHGWAFPVLPQPGEAWPEPPDPAAVVRLDRLTALMVFVASGLYWLAADALLMGFDALLSDERARQRRQRWRGWQR